MAEDTNREPIPYIERTRAYYRALGYEKDYVWESFPDVPFVRPAKPLSQMRVALITTAGPVDLSNRDSRSRKHVWSGPTAAAPTTFDTDLAWDKESTHTDDRETFLPVDAASKLAAAGIIKELTPHFHGAPTDYSHRKTMEEDAPEILRLIRAEEADAALLTAL